jgi:predicted metal-binding protein
MARFEHLLFVCTHERDADSSKPSCGRRGGKELLAALKEEVVAHKLKGRVRVVASGCLDFCSKGCALVALRAPSDDPNHSPAAESWYTHLTARDASGVFRAQVLANQQDQAHLEITRQLESTKR